MEWRNKGTEFENYKEIFQGKEILIYGASDIGKSVYQMLKFIGGDHLIRGFIDRRGGMIEAERPIKIMRFSEVSLSDYSNCVVILAARYQNIVLFAKQLRGLGLTEGKDFFYHKDFMEYYINIFSLYACNKVYAPFISMQVSTVCNLKCKGCVAFTPDNLFPCHFGLKKNIENADSIFANIDRINLLDVCGGEPFLDEDFGETIKYIGKNYRDRVNILRTVTNGTVVPDDKLCSVLKESDVTVVLDDYRANGAVSNNSFLKAKEQLEKFSISVEVRKAEYWIDLGIETNEACEKKETLVKIYSECCNSIRSLHDKKLYCCDYADFARQSGKYKEEPSDYLDFSIVHDKAVVTEFLTGYTETGYCGMCRYCNGCMTINNHYIPVAGQIRPLGNKGVKK